jgi:hypothetical protein
VSAIQSGRRRLIFNDVGSNPISPFVYFLFLFETCITFTCTLIYIYFIY